MWPLVSGRAVSIPLLLAVNLITTRGIRFDRDALKGTAWAGVLEATASMLILWALRRGPVAVAGVFGSLYPASTVLLAWLVLDEHLRALQKWGVVLTVVAIVLTAL
jgi:drug/metabolite transporter (DMT)-like permease